MKLDYLLQFYWSKGFFYLNKHFICKSPIQDYLSSLPYFSFYHRNFFLLRLEAPMSSFFLKINNLLITPTLFIYLNFLLITFFPIFSNPLSVQKLKIIFLYLLKTTKGRSHALGKPVHAQRTWSNAWTAYYYNFFLRKFLSQYLNQGYSSLKRKKKSNKRFRITPPRPSIRISPKNLTLWS